MRVHSVLTARELGYSDHILSSFSSFPFKYDHCLGNPKPKEGWRASFAFFSVNTNRTCVYMSDWLTTAWVRTGLLSSGPLRLCPASMACTQTTDRISIVFWVTACLQSIQKDQIPRCSEPGHKQTVAPGQTAVQLERRVSRAELIILKTHGCVLDGTKKPKT